MTVSQKDDSPGRRQWNVVAEANLKVNIACREHSVSAASLEVAEFRYLQHPGRS